VEVYPIDVNPIEVYPIEAYLIGRSIRLSPMKMQVYIKEKCKMCIKEFSTIIY
jgi:hypothetical protein